MDGSTAAGLVRASATRALFVALASLVSGCVTDQQKHDAITAVNTEFQRQYEQVLAAEGTHIVDVERARAFDAMAAALTSLGMRAETQDPGLGYLSFVAPAPKPLTPEEWQHAVGNDLPMMRDLVRPYVGFLAELMQFDPSAFDIVINVTIVAQGERSTVSLTMRMREVEQVRPSSFPRREYPPPTALRIGIAKVWSAFARELYPVQRRP
jgi:hypothetical protein